MSAEPLTLRHESAVVGQPFWAAKPVSTGFSRRRRPVALMAAYAG